MRQNPVRVRLVRGVVPKRVDPIPPHVWAPRERQTACALCEREGAKLTEHHLIPKAVHRKQRYRRMYDAEEMRTRKLLVCRACHNAIHRCIPDEKELAARYPTKEALLGNACLRKQVAYLSRQRVRGKQG